MSRTTTATDLTTRTDEPKRPLARPFLAVSGYSQIRRARAMVRRPRTLTSTLLYLTITTDKEDLCERHRNSPQRFWLRSV